MNDSAGPDRLDHRSRTVARGDMDYEEHHADQEQDPCDLRGDGRNAVEVEDSRNQADDEKYEGLVKHGRLLSIRERSICRANRPTPIRAGSRASPRYSLTAGCV